MHLSQLIGKPSIRRIAPLLAVAALIAVALVVLSPAGDGGSSPVMAPTGSDLADLPGAKTGHCYRVGSDILSPLTGGACAPSEQELEAAAAKCGGTEDDCWTRESTRKYPVLTPEIAKRYEQYSQANSPEPE